MMTALLRVLSRLVDDLAVRRTHEIWGVPCIVGCALSSVSELCDTD
jgi:hypothetical protein